MQVFDACAKLARDDDERPIRIEKTLEARVFADACREIEDQRGTPASIARIGCDAMNGVHGFGFPELPAHEPRPRLRPAREGVGAAAAPRVLGAASAESMATAVHGVADAQSACDSLSTSETYGTSTMSEVSSLISDETTGTRPDVPAEPAVHRAFEELKRRAAENDRPEIGLSRSPLNAEFLYQRSLRDTEILMRPLAELPASRLGAALTGLSRRLAEINQPERRAIAERLFDASATVSPRDQADLAHAALGHASVKVDDLAHRVIERADYLRIVGAASPIREKMLRAVCDALPRIETSRRPEVLECFTPVALRLHPKHAKKLLRDSQPFLPSLVD